MSLSIIILILILLTSCIFCQLTVRKNRGQILNMPEWKLIPQLTAYGTFFSLTLAICLATLYIQMHTSIKYVLILAAVPFVVPAVKKFCPPLLSLGKFILNQHVSPILTSVREGASADAVPYAASRQDCIENPDDSEANKKYRKELIGYLEYTIISFSNIFTILSTCSLLISFILEQNDLLHPLHKQWESIRSLLFFGVLLGSLIGVISTQIKGTEDFNITNEKRKKNKIAQIKKYLESESAKN